MDNSQGTEITPLTQGGVGDGTKYGTKSTGKSGADRVGRSNDVRDAGERQADADDDPRASGDAELGTVGRDCIPSGVVSASSRSDDDAELSAVVAAWATLPAAVKAGIAAMVKAAAERA